MGGTHDWWKWMGHVNSVYLRSVNGSVVSAVSISLVAPALMAVGEAEQGLAYWLRWQVAVCLVVLAVPAAVSVSVISSGRADPLRSSDLWLSCWKKASRFWLLGFRVVSLSILCFLLWQVLLLDRVFAFYFYTQWTFLLVIIYFLIASVISAYGCWMYGKCATENDEANAFLKEDVVVDIPVTLNATNRNKNASKSRSNYEHGYCQQKAGFWGYLMLIAYQTSAGAVVLTDIVFWGLLVPFLTDEHFKLDLLTGCMHTLNFIFLLLDTTLNSLPFPWFRMAYFVLWSCIYVIFQWILHACGFSWWPYPFLELSTSWAPLWYLCLGLLHIPCYGIYALIVSAKNSLFSRIFHHAYRRS
ncbi:uncharacterized protein LOC121982038 isoform X2 [Zingiber officinale]|uniref:uncharacterized protein LOC121982038 isoform X2 n=1 Tax=Zingiber officinale TaxID=94328 RepID=UPI001C4D5FDB|nr:uncharacterized protein LOC121982038 isoform X2 [Zingiber officinale]